MTSRLHPDHLDALPAVVARPAFDRHALQPGIVHLGIGAFMRAHLAPITEAALAAGDTRFGIVGVSLRQPDTRDALAPQDGLYTLAVRDADEHGQPRERLQVVGAVLSVLVAPEHPQAVLDQIADPATRIVSLTVTEKGYCLDPATGRLRLDHPDIAHDLAQSADAVAPVSAIGFLVRGLAMRRAQGRGPITLLSLDNLPANGHTLRGAVHAFAEAVDPALALWIDTHCTFPCSMVDRIVPRTTDADRDAISTTLGLRDAWPVLGESFLDWAVEDRFAAGRPDWTLGGARFVAAAEPWEHLKLRMVNGTHSCIAYLSVMAGWTTVDVAITQPDLRRFIEALMREEIEPTLPDLPGLDLAVYRQSLLQRYANPALAHRTKQIAMDGSQKLPQRLLGTVRDRLRGAAGEGQSVARLGLAVAAWLHFLRGVDELGQPYPIDDPQAEALTALHRATIAQRLDGDTVRAMLGYAPVFGDLASSAPLVEAVLVALQSLQSRGVAGTLRHWAVSGFDVLSIGETMAMLVADEPGPLAQAQHFSKRLAGADTNVAIGLARLGLRVGWISRLGADSFGDYVRSSIEAEGIDTSQVQTDPTRSTGFMLKTRSVDGRDPAIEYYRRGSAASQLGPQHFDAAWALQARHLHATGITPALSPAACELVVLAMRSFRASGRSVSFDPNLRPSLWPDAATMRDTLNALAAHADWVLPGIEEGRLLTGRDTPDAIADFYLERGARAVVVKLGADGAHVRTAEGASLHVPGEVVPRIVDTVGAGDAFAVGIISARLEGRSWPDALRRANWIASRALQVVGDMEGLPMRHELPTTY